ncbi:nitrite reductase small subunit NirD [Shewanella pealeana]|uniref:Nitrite reductase (NAD(P)H), small subunit n=1 Tax=Shewanella pealeana (strain ATCC 700345 / ANG-SQ1) TaxID=398579 RepID=A8H3J8_SHEPA|nr:nitrite reductase small subunit NirD [Shewanella pealeana]ABV87135.1 nitrite reductase (NAD(P)H), small subunit [Shewanella pealeana ATCC 700345]
MSWVALCDEAKLPKGQGVAAWLDNRKIALFNLGEKGIFALDNIDPATGVAVLSRGLVCELNDELYVASPIHKQHYHLSTGQCLENDGLSVICYELKKEQGRVLAKLPFQAACASGSALSTPVKGAR